MIRLAALLWVIGGTTLAGVAILIVLMIPSMQDNAVHNVLIAALAGFAVGLPLAWVAAKSISARRGG